MTPIKDIPQFRKDCKRFQDAIAGLNSEELKSQLTSLYKDFLIKVSAVDRSLSSIPPDFKEVAFTHKQLVDDLTHSRMRIENFIKSNIK